MVTPPLFTNDSSQTMRKNK